MAGLSPLARGTQFSLLRGYDVSRFIPAGAGNTRFFCTPDASLPGLSPLARGTLLYAQTKAPVFRFIPAGAGNTAAGARSIGAGAVYPRWRGEHSWTPYDLTGWAGLSPLARGTLFKLSKESTFKRFIPAGAGNTRRRVSEGRWSAVYPRWRGEHTATDATANAIPGLSPLARGTLLPRDSPTRRPRFIPAGAGNTSSNRF